MATKKKDILSVVNEDEINESFIENYEDGTDLIKEDWEEDNNE